MKLTLRSYTNYDAPTRVAQNDRFREAIAVSVFRDSDTSLALAWHEAGNAGVGLARPQKSKFIEILRELGTTMWCKEVKHTPNSGSEYPAADRLIKDLRNEFFHDTLQREIDSVFTDWLRRSDPSMFIIDGQHRCVAIQNFISAKSRRKVISSVFDEIDLSIFRNDALLSEAEELISEVLYETLEEFLQIRICTEGLELRKQDENPRDCIFKYGLRTGCSPPSAWACKTLSYAIHMLEGATVALSNFRPESGRARPPDGYGNRLAQGLSHTSRS
ncbi:hypothetical protein [Aurantiacibacter luteus]|uniref:hypothetical protein n=1 Tax=Aurantiacibacter luteus TaxID=1581420 RepID=UPI000AA1D275|nr:hypothetical protein [Aurantiacibacter luteus]